MKLGKNLIIRKQFIGESTLYFLVWVLVFIAPFMNAGLMSEEIADHDACKIEHDLSDITFEKIKAFYTLRTKSIFLRFWRILKPKPNTTNLKKRKTSMNQNEQKQNQNKEQENQNKEQNKNQNKKAMNLIFWIMPVVSLFSNGVIYATAFGMELDVIRLMPLLLGLMFVFIGNYMPKCIISF